jgi:hypothetical protein
MILTTRVSKELHRWIKAEAKRNDRSVIADFRSFNRCFGRYASEQQARRRLRDLLRGIPKTNKHIK